MPVATVSLDAGADINARSLDFKETPRPRPFAAGKEAKEIGKSKPGAGGGWSSFC